MKAASAGGTLMPGQPIQVKSMRFLQPESAETRPPLDSVKE
jgi:hypothetical protein